LNLQNIEKWVYRWLVVVLILNVLLNVEPVYAESSEIQDSIAKIDIFGYHISKYFLLEFFISSCKIVAFLFLIIYFISKYINIKQKLIENKKLQGFLPIYTKILYYNEKIKPYKFYFFCTLLYIYRISSAISVNTLMSILVPTLLFIGSIIVYMYITKNGHVLFLEKIPYIGAFFKKKPENYQKVREIEVNFSYLDRKLTPDIIKLEKQFKFLESNFWIFFCGGNVFTF